MYYHLWEYRQTHPPREGARGVAIRRRKSRDSYSVSDVHCNGFASLYTVWPEILAGNLFWRIGGFESNPPIFHPPKTSV